MLCTILLFFQLPRQDIHEPHIPEKIYQLAREIIERLDQTDFLENDYERHDEDGLSEERGTVLVFLPG